MKESSDQYSARIFHPMTRIFLDEEPAGEESGPFSGLQNEVISFVVAYSCTGTLCPYAEVRTESLISGYCRIREICSVPSVRPVNSLVDDNYQRTEPGLYPDLLTDLKEGQIQFVAGIHKSLWVDVEIPEGGPWGQFPIAVVFTGEDGAELCRAKTQVDILNVTLQPQKFLHTEWFHGDCLADFYQIPVFSEKHWKIMEDFVTLAAKRGCNMILTPQFTPPLDTRPGGERTTIQLVEIKVTGEGEYEFGFERMERWVKMCQRAGMMYFEMSHLFTQWGAAYPPKVMAQKDGRQIRLFQWDEPATGGEYERFLGIYLPRLIEKLKEWGIDRRTWFHISDEPEEEQLLSYKKARDVVAPYLEGFSVMDAISSLKIYQKGEIHCPVCANDHIEPFIREGVTSLWTYYCTAQSRLVSNRFMSMPLARCRILGFQIFRHNLEGMLHWGYNFYNSQYSVFHLNPYCSTDAGGAFPSGDAFLVYPGRDGKPEESLRMMTMCHVMQDIRAMEQLAELKGREYVAALLDESLKEPVTFRHYPHSPNWILKTRERINRKLEKEARNT